MCFLHKKNTQDFILESSLTGIHLFQDHSADNASMSRSNQEAERAEKLKNLLSVSVYLGSLRMKRNFFFYNKLQKQGPLQRSGLNTIEATKNM